MFFCSAQSVTTWMLISGCARYSTPGTIACHLKGTNSMNTAGLGHGLLLKELDIVVPEVNMFYGTGIQFVIHIRIVRTFIILSGCIDAQCLEPGFKFAI